MNNFAFLVDLAGFIRIIPGSPHLNGKVERTQQTDKSEFWSLFDLSDINLDLNA